MTRTVDGFLMVAAGTADTAPDAVTRIPDTSEPAGPSPREPTLSRGFLEYSGSAFVTK
jgi:hypothetical protein